MNNGIRLQLVLAKAGVASRRGSETLITAGRVAVNGQVVTELGTRVDPVSDQVTVDGKSIQQEAPAYFLLNKPKGYVTTASDPEGRQTVFELLPDRSKRLFAVGRLDYNTEGALLLTNDGELAHVLMHPSRGVEKIYHAKMRGHISEEQADKLRHGVVLPPARVLDSTGRPVENPYPQRRGAPEKQERSAPCGVVVRKDTGQHSWLEFVLHEGKNRQIHRMAEAIGSSLLKLQRVQYAGLSIADLPIGEVRELSKREVAELRRSVGLTAALAVPASVAAAAAAAKAAAKPVAPKPFTPKPFPAKPAPAKSAAKPAARPAPRGEAPERRPPRPQPAYDERRGAGRDGQGPKDKESRGPARAPARSDSRAPSRSPDGRAPRRPTYAPSLPR